MRIQPKVDRGFQPENQSGTAIYLDISRLLSAGRRNTPSGIERVELAYATYFGSATTCLVAGFLGELHILPHYFAYTYIKALETGWKRPGRSVRLKTIGLMGLMYLVMLFKVAGRLLPKPTASQSKNLIYLNLSHENLSPRGSLARLKARTGAIMVFFVHDLIPITHPEYARPNQAQIHRRRMDTVGALGDAVLVNSAATKNDLVSYLSDRPQLPAIHVVHLGITPDAPPAADEHDPPAAQPYFLILATIEPRKNHLLLLNLWRRLAEESLSPPRLIIAGRRGWENEMVLDMLERCEAVSGIVEERRDVSDAALGPLLRGAAALLLPSFAEGFGLPVAEALAAGTPVICSDLPALREIGGDVPEYLDPLDGVAWRQAILDYAATASPRRAAQLERLRSWSAFGWDGHFAQVSVILQGLVQPGQPG